MTTSKVWRLNDKGMWVSEYRCTLPEPYQVYKLISVEDLLRKQMRGDRIND